MSQGLSPPPPSRLRASSTTLRPPHSLGRRRSSSSLTIVPNQPTPHPPSMLVIIASRFLEWFHLHPKHSFSWSTPSSPRSSADDYVLPLSASAHKSSFGVDIQDSISKSHLWPHPFLSMHTQILLVVLLFPLSTALVLWSLSTLPISLAWPKTIADVAQLGSELNNYTQSGSTPTAHVVGVVAITAIWKHAWSIPGSVIWNVVSGALFSPAYATLLLTALTMVGSACATLLATPLAPFLTHFFPRALDMTRSALEGDSDPDLNNSVKPRSSAWVRLSVLRLIGVVPWSGINIACGVCGVSLSDCMFGAFIGSLPWTAVTCQIGDILQTVASTSSPTPESISSLLTTPQIVFKLIFLSFLSLAPILGRDRLRMLISHSSPRPSTQDSVSRWSRVHEWRSKIRMPSRSRGQVREQNLKELEVLVQEKQAFELAS